MTTNSNIVIGIIVAFYILNAAIIKLAHKPQTSIEEYGVGGRSMGWLLVCFSYMGGWYVGAVYTGWFAFSADLGLFAQYIIIYSTASLAVLYVMAKPVWTWGKEYNLETQSDLIQLRYGSAKFSLIHALLITIVGGTWLVVEMITLGYIVSAATNQVVSFNAGMFVLGSGVILYSLIGGVRASAVGALIQGVTFTVIGTITFYVLIVKAYGGVIPLMELVEQNRPDLLILDPEKSLDWKWISAILTGTLGAFCWPNIFARMFMTSSPRETKKVVYVAPLAALFIALMILWLALGGRMLPGFPQDAQSGVFWMANQYGGPIALGLVAVFASSAAVSTISASANSIAVLIAKNLLGNFVEDQQAVLRYAKIATLLLGIISMAIATLELPQLIEMALIMYDCIVQVIVPLLFGLFWKRGNLKGAIMGLSVGMIITLGTLINPALIAWAGGISGGIIGLLVNALVYILCGYWFGKQSHVDALFETLQYYDDEGNKWSSPFDDSNAVMTYRELSQHVK